MPSTSIFPPSDSCIWLPLEVPWTNEYFPRARCPHKLPVLLSMQEVLSSFFGHETGETFNSQRRLFFPCSLQAQSLPEIGPGGKPSSGREDRRRDGPSIVPTCVTKY